MAETRPALVFIGFMGAGKSTALRERTDSAVVPAAAVVAEAMVCLALARAYREKFGGDHIDDVLAALDAYKQRIDFRG